MIQVFSEILTQGITCITAIGEIPSKVSSTTTVVCTQLRSLLQSKFSTINNQINQMWSILPYDIIAEIIDTVGEDKDTELLKELSLVSHSFHQICCEYLFATVELHDHIPKRRVAFTKKKRKKSFVKLLKSRPDVVKYIRKLTYEVSYYNDEDFRLSPTLPKFLRTISRLNCLTIDCSMLRWNSPNFDSSLTSAFLYLMHLPTMNHIDLSCIEDFPLSSLTPSVNLLRLDIRDVQPLEKEVVVQSEMMPKIREFHTSGSALLTTKLLHAKKQDGQPAFNFMDLRRLSICLRDKQNVRYLLQKAKLLEKLHLSQVNFDQTLEGLYNILSTSAGTLKVLDLTLVFYPEYLAVSLQELCEELEAMTGHTNTLEALSLEVKGNPYETADEIGSIIQSVEEVLVNPGWSVLRHVSFKVPVLCCCWENTDAKLAEELQSLLPDKYLGHLSKLESVALLSAFRLTLLSAAIVNNYIKISKVVNDE
jgi:hypothetical protein